MLLSANQGCRTEALAKCKFDLILMSNTGSACLRDHPSQRLMIKCLTIIQIEFEFGNGCFWGEGKTGLPGEKPLGTRKRTNNKETQPTYDAGSGNRTLDTLVRGERSHHCTIPAHLKETKLLKGRRRGQNYTKMSQIRIPKEINRWSTANLRVNYRDY